MKSGALGVAIIIIAFLGTSVIYSIEPTQTIQENLNYNPPENLLENKEFSPKYHDYVIPPNEERNKNPASKSLATPVQVYNKIHYFSHKAGYLISEIIPFEDVLNSLKYSEKCDLVTIDFNLKMKSLEKHNILYPSTPILCILDFQWFQPTELNQNNIFKDMQIVNNTIVNYRPGEPNVYINSCDENGLYRANGGTSFPISKLYIAHHYSKLHYKVNLTKADLLINESEYKIKWHENSNLFPNPIINIKDKHPEDGHSKVTLNNFIQYGNEVTINGQTFHVINGKIIIDKKQYSIQNIDIYYDNDTCLLKLNNDELTKDLGKIKNYIISGRGDWGFIPLFYEGHITQSTTSKFNMNPFDISQMDGSAIILFIAIVIILSGICSYSPGLYFTDWAIILTTIAILLIMW